MDNSPCLRLEKAIDRMVRGLAAPLQLADLADVTHYSPWHLAHRFQSEYGDSPQAFLWQLRLEVAASLLQWSPHLPIGQVADLVGFSSPATFSRAFGRSFGFTPSDLRAGRAVAICWIANNLGSMSYRPGLTIAGTDADRIWSWDEVEAHINLEEWPAGRMAYQRAVGDYGFHLEKFLERFQEQCQTLGIKGDRWFGLVWSDPATTPAERRRYDVAVPISSHFKLPRLLGEYQCPAGRWAVFRHVGERADIGPRWRDLMLVWLPYSGWMLDPQRPRVECYYDGRYDLCLPLLPGRSIQDRLPEILPELLKLVTTVVNDK
ncbi:AraC family transcriptional regulator [Iodobacter ciconiae]|uniref:AraC family transcriptional regulator n=1 Tax=Iodobacter ciconiae TaxID=2496266 RepID=A0A3S8ZV11_9NEIS|nr:AraC family transcriptional regulator [Iodobacter ciconiae]AZN37343.1 AraC family transcriptional regulator [Iodobacter ciconiae]